MCLGVPGSALNLQRDGAFDALAALGEADGRHVLAGTHRSCAYGTEIRDWSTVGGLAKGERRAADRMSIARDGDLHRGLAERRRPGVDHEEQRDVFAAGPDRPG